MDISRVHRPRLQRVAKETIIESSANSAQTPKLSGLARSPELVYTRGNWKLILVNVSYARVVVCGMSALFAGPFISVSMLAQELRLPTLDRFLTELPTTLYSIGTQEGEHWEMLYGVRDVAFDSADYMYVLDAGNRRVLQFDPQGQFVRQMGREGMGPGEFAGPVAIEVTHQGLIVVSDVRHGFVVFDSNGNHVRNVRYRERTGSVAVGLGVAPVGEVFWLDSSPSFGSDPDSTYWSVYRHSLQEDDDPTLLLRFLVAQQLRTIVTSTGFAVRRSAQYSVAPSLGVLPDGSVVVLKDEDYIVRVFGATGQETRQMVGSVRARRVTEEDREAWYERNARSLPTVRYEMPFADRMSVLTGVRTDPAGRIWIRRRGPDGAESGPIDLVTGGGRYIGTVLDQGMPAAVSESNVAAYIERDDLGVERVVVRRLPQSWSVQVR